MQKFNIYYKFFEMTTTPLLLTGTIRNSCRFHRFGINSVTFSRTLIRNRCNSALVNHHCNIPSQNSNHIRTIQPPSTLVISQRNLFGGLENNRKQIYERKILGYSMEELFYIVAEVEQYKHFIPYCMNSVVTSRTSAKRFKANLTIGIPPLLEESYESDVTLTLPTQVKSVSPQGSLFNYMESIWKFSPGPNGNPKSCTFDFYMAFEFRSLLHSQLSQVFFDQGVRKIADAFAAEAKRRYGLSSI